jgi:hypothetical protein
MDIAAIRAAVATSLSSLQIRVYDYETLKPDPPCAIVHIDSVPNQEALGGLRRPTVTVQLLVSMSNPEQATRQIDRWLSRSVNGSVFDALATISGYKISDPEMRSGSYLPVLGPDGGTALLSTEITFDIF